MYEQPFDTNSSSLIRPLGEASAVLAIDTSNLMWRAMSAENKRYKDKDGKPRGHLYGFLDQLKDLLLRIPVTDGVSLVFGLDSKGSKRRRLEIYPEYKAKRNTAKEKFFEAYGLSFEEVRQDIQDLIETLPHQQLGSPDFECDDLLAALPKHFPSQRIYIATNDRDLWRLMKYPRVTIFGQASQVITQRVFEEEFGFSNHNLLLPYKALFGDASDNIPSILPKVRRQPIVDDVICKASSFSQLSKMLKDYPGDKKSAENVRALANAEDFDTRFRRNLLLVNFLDVDSIPNYLSTFDPGNKENLVKLLQRYNLQNMANDLPFFGKGFDTDVNQGKVFIL